ncbi:site-specific integrase [Okeanomitos corallinicola TIOX110]|uniref:Site-specific integrase n=1 Tax=Okeanomitos corallinicola TIOX110 TaxID=3133117 RepID=A0ABZ2URU1_9CYAN
MLKTKLHKGYQASTVKTATTDGTYIGTMKHLEKQAVNTEIQFDIALKEVNARLKAANSRVAIVQVAGSLYLQATLPLKPHDINTKGKNTKQYKISLNIPANFYGLKTAEEEANELAKLIARQQFTWTSKYLGNKQEQGEKTFGELLDNYEKIYFSSRQRNIKSEGTFFKNYLGVLNQFDRNMLAIPENIKRQFDNISNDTPSWKHRTSIALNLFCKEFNIPLVIKFKRPKPKPRQVPDESMIEDGFYQWEKYAHKRRNKRREQADYWIVFRWFYGMLATYGCRPRELFLYPDFQHWLSENKTWKVHELCKTGEREALPLYDSWIELFDLKNPQVVKLVQDYINGRDDTKGMHTLSAALSDWFNKVDLGFSPYDLRHAWAIRAHLMGIPIKAAADNLGHSVQQHTDTYQRWFGLENRKKAISHAVKKQDELQELREEIVKLKAENQELRNLLDKYQIIQTLHNN